MPHTSSPLTPPIALSTQEIALAVSGHISRWLFGPPGQECYHSPSIDDQIRADKFEALLTARIIELAARGIAPLEMSARELLPWVHPHAIELTEADYLAYC